MTAEEIAKGMRAYAHQLIEIADILHPIDKKVPRTREKVLPLETEEQGVEPQPKAGEEDDRDDQRPSGGAVEGSQDERVRPEGENS